ncbi:MAG TPA: hypothetical protein VJ915_04155 [Balneolaceae bacterium]|nr:hypothetical protein [Balneolaceae bacterium]
MGQRLKVTSLLFAMFLFTAVSCGDDSTTGTDQPEPPAVPEAVPAEINSSIFDNNNPTGENFDLFNQAAIYAETAAAQINGGTILGQTYLEFTRSSESEFEDGTWTWNFTSSQSGFDVSVRTTAEQLQNGFQWDIFVSGTFNGETVNEFSFLSGFISDDGSTGSWQYFSPGDSDQPILEYQWEVIDDSQTSFSTIFSGFSSDDQQRIDYVQNGADNTLEYTGFSSVPDLVIYWNSESGAGYIDREGEDRQCWDESFAEVACS